MALLELAMAALALWGWGGMEITVVERDLDWGIAAQSNVDGYPHSCYIEIDPVERTPRTLVHEVGHCLGYWWDGGFHSPNPESVMSDLYHPGQTIDLSDWEVIRRSRLHLGLTPRAVMVVNAEP